MSSFIIKCDARMLNNKRMVDFSQTIQIRGAFTLSILRGVKWSFAY